MTHGELAAIAEMNRHGAEPINAAACAKPMRPRDPAHAREVAAEVLDGQRDAVADELRKAFDLCDREIENWMDVARRAERLADGYRVRRETILDELSERRRARK